MAIPFDKLPRNIEAEKSTLGAMILSKRAKDEGLSSLKIDDFFLDVHKKIFEAIFNLNDKNIPVDFQTLTQELKTLKILDEIGGTDYLYDLTQSMLTEDNVKEYIDIIKSNANLRNLFLTMKGIEEDYLKKNIDSYTSFVANAQSKIDKVAEERKISNFLSSKEIVDQVSQHIYTLKEKRKERELTGVDTGFKLLNYYTNGLQKQNLIIIAGRPGTGKTALALNIALNAAKLDQIPVAIFEMEMSSVMLYTRLVSNLSSVPSRNINSGKLDDRENVKVIGALNTLADLKIYVDESSALTILDIVAKAHKLKSEQPDLGLIVIDYIGLISSDGKKNKRYDSRQLEIQEYTRILHELAREINVPIVLLCQLNRKVEDRGEGGVPRLSDLRESGSIEQDAEIVLLLHRSDYGKNELVLANDKSKVKASEMSADARHQLVEAAKQRVINENLSKEDNIKNTPYMSVIIAKNRNGESDQTVKLLFEKEYSRFQDVGEEFYKKEKAIQDKYRED